MLHDVQAAIRKHNAEHPSPDNLSDRNPANFFKDFVRRRDSANLHFPKEVFEHGFTARQVTQGGACFEFVPVDVGQTEPFPSKTPQLSAEALDRVHKIQSMSLPLAS